MNGYVRAMNVMAARVADAPVPPAQFVHGARVPNVPIGRFVPLNEFQPAVGRMADLFPGAPVAAPPAHNPRADVHVPAAPLAAPQARNPQADVPAVAPLAAPAAPPPHQLALINAAAPAAGRALAKSQAVPRFLGGPVHPVVGAAGNPVPPVPGSEQELQQWKKLFIAVVQSCRCAVVAKLLAPC